MLPEPTDAEDVLAVSREFDTEAYLLCALMWAGKDHPPSDRVCGFLQPADFFDPHHGALFGFLASRRSAGHPTDPVSLNSALSALGDEAPLPRHIGRHLLMSLSTLSVPAELVTDYADQVLGESYRRQYQAMAQAVTHAGESAREERLFDILVDHGRAQRAAWERRQSFRTRESE